MEVSILKKILILLFMVLTILILPISFADTTKVVYPLHLYINGVYLDSPDSQPFIDENGRSMIPLKAVSETLGAEISWDGKTYTAKVKLGDKTIELPVGKNYGMVNGVKSEFDTITIVSNGRTFVPLKFVSENLGYEIGYKFGKDPLAGNKLAHIITIGTSSGTLSPMVNMGWKAAGLNLEQSQIYYSMFKKIPASDTSITQVVTMSRNFYMSLNPSDGSSFNWVYIISYEAPGSIDLSYNMLPTGWDEFTINSLTALIGSDGTYIGSQIVKDVMSTYVASENRYYASKLSDKVITSGKYTFKYSTGKITWVE